MLFYNYVKNCNTLEIYFTVLHRTFVTNVNIIGLKYELHVELLPVSDISMNLYENCYAIASVLNDSSATVMFASLMRYILTKLNKIILMI